MIIRDLIAQLTVKADTNKVDRFNKSVDKSKTKLNKASTATGGFRDKIKSMSSALKGFIAIAVGSVVFKTLITGFATSADHIAKFSLATGIATDAYQGWIYVAGLGGIAANEVEASFVQLTKRSYEASIGMKRSSEAFNTMGISVKDGNGQLKDANALLLEISDYAKKHKDDPRLKGLLMQVFGKKGTALIPMLIQGKTKIQDLFKEAKKFGGILSPEELKKAEDFNDAILRFKTVLKGLFSMLSVNILPSITKTITKFTDWTKEGDKLKDTIKKIKTAAKALALVLASFGIAKVIMNFQALNVVLVKTIARLYATAAAAVAANIKLALITAAIAAILWIGKELYSWYAGKGSVFDKFFDNEAGEDLRDTIDELVASFKKLWKTIEPQLKKLGAAFADISKKALKLFKKTLPAAMAIVSVEIYKLIAIITVLSAVIETSTAIVEFYIKSYEDLFSVIKDLEGPLKEFYKLLFGTDFDEDKMVFLKAVKLAWEDFAKFIENYVLDLAWTFGFMVGLFIKINKRIYTEVMKLVSIFTNTKTFGVIKKTLSGIGFALRSAFSTDWIITAWNKVVGVITSAYNKIVGILPPWVRKRLGLTKVKIGEPSRKRRLPKGFIDYKTPNLPPSRRGQSRIPTTASITNRFDITVAVDGSVDMTSEDFNEKLKEGATKVFADIVHYEYMTRVPA